MVGVDGREESNAQANNVAAAFGRRVALAMATLVAGAAGAHHGWGSYDAERPLTVEGRIAEVAYGNPHVEIVVEADGTRW